MSSAQGRARLVVAAVPVATWFLVGYLSEEGGTDHIVEIRQLDRPVEIFLGVLAALIALGAGWSFLGRSRNWLIDEGWWRVYVRLLGCGLFLAVGARIVTAGSSGANIGGGMLLLFGPLLLLYLWGRAREEAIRVRSAAPPGWMPSAFEWLWRGGGGTGPQVAVAMITGLVAIMLIPWQALVAVASVGGLMSLAARNRRLGLRR